MKSVINGLGVDVTTTVLTWLKSGQNIRLATLYLIGERDDPEALWLTDWESPLLWSLYGTFYPAVIKRGNVSTKIGLEVTTLEITWSPAPVAPMLSMQTAGPYQRAVYGYYDNWPVRVWTVYMPSAGDADTYGCSELFGGRIGTTIVDRGEIRFTVNSFLDVINLDMPTQTIEISNPMASFVGATNAPGVGRIPQFNIIAGSTTNLLICQCIDPLNNIFTDDILHNGFVVFQPTVNATLGKLWSAIQNNRKTTIGGTDYNAILLYTALPFAPTPGVDTIYVSGAAPINRADGSYIGFPYVPCPEQSL